MNREILRLAIPNIISNLSVPLLSTVDTALMGRLSEEHIGAVGLGSMIFNFIYWNFGFLRMGTTGITAQFFGAHDRKGMITTLVRALLIALILALAMLLLQVWLRNAGLWFMNTQGDVRGYVGDYFNIRIWAAPATLMTYVAMGWFFGMQNAIYPLIITIGINVVNIIVSYVLVFEMGMEIDGVAWGTVAAQYFGVLISLVLFRVRYAEYVQDLAEGALRQIEPFRRFLNVNRDIFLRTLCLTFAFGFFYSQSSSLGAAILAVNVILLQYVNWLSYAIDGFAYATESIVGKYFGAGNRELVLKAIDLNFRWAFVLSAGFAAVYLVWGKSLLWVFTDQPDVISACMDYMWWMAILPVAGFACYIWDGVYIGLTASRAMRDTMIIALAIFLILYYLWFENYGNHGLWLGLTVFLAARGALQWVWYKLKGLALS